MTSQQPATIDRRDLIPHTGQQMSVFATREALAKPWRVAAQTALHDPHFSETDRQKRHAYYMGKANEIDRGEQ